MRKILALILAFVAVPAFADHPGDRLGTEGTCF